MHQTAPAVAMLYRRAQRLFPRWRGAFDLDGLDIVVINDLDLASRSSRRWRRCGHRPCAFYLFVRSPHVAHRRYSWWSPLTRGISTTLPWIGGCTFRGSGASLSSA